MGFLRAVTASLSVLLILTSSAHAIVVTPGVVIPGSAPDSEVDTFGAIPVATFGGSGIPNDTLAISTVVDGANTITMGITATPRFTSLPAPTNDGLGTFEVPIGESDPGLSKWNFSFYTDIEGPGSFANYRFELSYDLNSAVGTDLSDHGVLNLNGGVVFLGGLPLLTATTTVQDSQNLGFSFLSSSAPGIVAPPTPTPAFDPFETGEYTFQIRVYDDLAAGALLDQVSMRVNAVPEASAPLCFALVSCVLGGIQWMKRKRQVEIA